MKKIIGFIVLLVIFMGCIQQQVVTTEDTIEKDTGKQDDNLEKNNTDKDNEEEIIPPENTTLETEGVEIKELEKGEVDPSFEVELYLPEKAWNGYTLLPDNHDIDHPRVVEVNMLGEIVWEYVLPTEFIGYTNPGFDVELLPNNNIQIELPRKGIFEINKSGSIVWEYRTEKISHDADRLPNGNILFAFGSGDTITDAQAKEITPDGKVVWSWYAKNEYNKAPYNEISDQGWTHTNAVLRMENGNTLISPRNFDMLVEVNSDGEVVKEIGKGIMKYQHDPVFLDNGNILFANHDEPNEIIEINPDTNDIIWKYTIMNQQMQPVRDADRLPNGNTLLTGTNSIIEITSEGEVVWVLKLKNVQFTKENAPEKGFYKAERTNVLIK